MASYAVTDFGGLNYPNFSVFGNYGGSGTFACWIDDPDNSVLWVQTLGTDATDYLNNTYPPANLKSPTTGAFLGVIEGNGEFDLIYGSDVVASNHYDDNLYGNDGADTIYGQTGDDYLVGNGGDDTIYGGPNDDHIDGLAGADTIYGEAGSDLVHAGPGADYVDLGAGADQCYGEEDSDTLLGGDGDDALFGDAGSDILQGQAGDDDLYGGPGADVVCAGLSGSFGDYLSGASFGATEATDSVDKLWSPAGSSAAPSGASQPNDVCGHTSWGTTWAGTSCSYTLSTQPTECL